MSKNLLKRENLSDKLADIIGRKIIRNELKSGEIIYETQIAKEWGVSRSPVRDALHILMQIRLVERTSRGNYQVTVLTIPLIQHLYEITNILYQYAFSNAAVKATSKDLLVMQQHLARLEKSKIKVVSLQPATVDEMFNYCKNAEYLPVIEHFIYCSRL